MAQKGYKIRGIAPPDLASYPTSVRVLYWGWVVEFGLRRKDKELSQGLDKDGDPMRPIKQETREHRRSAMTPSGRGDPSAPPLDPGWQKSRTRSLLAGRALSSHAEFYWRYDAFTGDTWAVILGYQAQQGRDVFGLSPGGTRWVDAQARNRWEAWKAGQYRIPTKATQAAPEPIGAVGRTDERFLVRGANAGAAGPNAGYMTVKEWQAHFRETARVSIPGRAARPASKSPAVGPDYNRLLGHVWTPRVPPPPPAKAVAVPPFKPSGPSKPLTARVTVSMPPKPAPKPAPAPPRPVPIPIPRPRPRPVPAAKPVAATFDEQINAALKGVTDFTERRSILLKAIEEHAVEVRPVAIHGMANPEAFRKVRWMGIDWHFTGTADAGSKIYYTISGYRDFGHAAKVPARLREATKSVYFTGQANSDDDYWRANRKNFTKSHATGGGGNIVVYDDNYLDIGNFSHEAGHNLAHELYGSSKPAKEYGRLLETTTEPPVSKYAATAPSEDFAEAVRVYVTDADRMKATHPERHAIIRKLMTESSYGG